MRVKWYYVWSWVWKFIKLWTITELLVLYSLLEYCTQPPRPQPCDFYSPCSQNRLCSSDRSKEISPCLSSGCVHSSNHMFLGRSLKLLGLRFRILTFFSISILFYSYNINYVIKWNKIITSLFIYNNIILKIHIIQQRPNDQIKESQKLVEIAFSVEWERVWGQADPSWVVTPPLPRVCDHEQLTELWVFHLFKSAL